MLKQSGSTDGLRRPSAQRELLLALPKLLDSVVHSVSLLALHLSGKHILTEGELELHRRILRLFKEAIDDLPSPKQLQDSTPRDP